MGKKYRQKKPNYQAVETVNQLQNPSTWQIDEEKRADLKAQDIHTDMVRRAILVNDLDAVKSFVKLGFPIPKVDEVVGLRLVEEDNDTLLKYLIKELNFDFKNLKDNTLLIIAIRFGAFKCVKFLLEEGFDPNDQGGNGYSPLQFAIMYNKPKMAMLLIKHKAKFDEVTFKILARSKILIKEAHLILESVTTSPKAAEDFKKKYAHWKKGEKLHELCEKVDDSPAYNTECLRVMNDYHKLVFLKEYNLLPKIIKDGQANITKGFKLFNNVDGRKCVEALLSCLTDIYKILAKPPQTLQNYEKFENFLVESLDKLKDISFILEFNKMLLREYSSDNLNFGKIIQYGEKVYDLLKQTEGSAKEKSQVLQKLITRHIAHSNNEEKVEFYKKEVIKLIKEDATIIDKDFFERSIDSLNLEHAHYAAATEFGVTIKGNNYEAYIQELRTNILKNFQAKKQWEQGDKFLEEIYNDKNYLGFSKSYKSLDFKYYEFIFNYHKDKSSPRAEEILNYFYDQALKSQDKAWSRNIHKLYEIVIYQELEDQNEEKLSFYLEQLKILPRTSRIQSLQAKLEFLLNNLKHSQVSEEVKTVIEENATIPIKEEIILRLPKEGSKTFDEIERLLAFENFEEIAKIDQKLLRKYFIYKKAELEKEKYVEEIEEASQFSWCVKGKIYKSEKAQQIDKDGKWYAAISENLGLDKVRLEKYQDALEHGFAKREVGAKGIKYHSNQLKLKINKDDSRLIANNCYKNLQEKYLVILQDEKPHSQIKDNAPEFKIYNDDNLESYLAGETENSHSL